MVQASHVIADFGLLQMTLAAARHPQDLAEVMPTVPLPHIGSCALQGTHKILKKHDKMVPHAPCRQFWISHLHSQSWVQASPCPQPEP